LGKLRDLKERREQMDWDDPNRVAIEEEINKIEQWCIDNNKGFVTKLTTWTNGLGGDNELYPWHTGYIDVKDIWMVGSLNGKGLNYNTDKSIHICQHCS
jgi:hypothetical protein